MRMIHGSALFGYLKGANITELTQKESGNIRRMLTAVDDCQWDGSDLQNLSVAGALSVLGLQSRGEATTQTIVHRLGDMAVVADVRLDNRVELSAMFGLREPIHDAELILRAYQKWGSDCAVHLLGDFSFVLWDGSASRLFCARDFVGTRPFYYHYSPRTGRFVFTSDLISMTAHSDVPTELNLSYVAGELRLIFGHFYDQEHTFFQEIKKLPPAHCLTVDAGGLKQWAYWQPAQIPERRYADEREYVEELRALLQKAISCRITDPYPIGAHISGGLDSSSMAVLGNRILQEQGRSLTGFSWAPPLPANMADLLPNDERKLVEAVRVAERFPIQYTRLTVKHLQAHASRDRALQPTTTLQYELASSEQAADLGIRTILSGWGGDELIAFNGRGYFADLFRRGRWITLFHEMSQRGELQGSPVWKQLVVSGILPLLPTGLLMRIKPSEIHTTSALPLPEYIRPEFAAALTGVKPLSKPATREIPGIRRMQIYLLNLGHLNYRMDSWASHGARLGITYVFPLVDRRIAEFALSIPDYYYFKNGWKRYLYRVAMEGILPDVVRWQKVKEDPAMSQGLWDAHKSLAGELWADLLAQAGNPYMDVEKFRTIIETANTEHTSQKQHIGRARWLAFMNSKRVHEGEF